MAGTVWYTGTGEAQRVETTTAMATPSSSCLHSSSAVILLPSSPRFPRRVCFSSQSLPLRRLAAITPLWLAAPLRRGLRTRSSSRLAVVAEMQSNIFKVLRTTWMVAKDGIEAGANLVPDPIPRPIARIGVAGVGTVVALILLKSFLSTLFFVLAMMGIIYFTYMAMNASDAPRGEVGKPSTDDDALEEARRIMEKYK